MQIWISLIEINCNNVHHVKQVPVFKCSIQFIAHVLYTADNYLPEHFVLVPASMSDLSAADAPRR